MENFTSNVPGRESKRDRFSAMQGEHNGRPIFVKEDKVLRLCQVSTSEHIV